MVITTLETLAEIVYRRMDVPWMGLEYQSTDDTIVGFTLVGPLGLRLVYSPTAKGHPVVVLTDHAPAHQGQSLEKALEKTRIQYIKARAIELMREGCAAPAAYSTVFTQEAHRKPWEQIWIPELHAESSFPPPPK